MSDIIQLLPDHVANQIAAGEVIQRPASAVKELLENAIDAGATSIKLIIKDAGRTLIQVIDNGCGMSETDARMCFERHATSKIKEANDIHSIRTMGFRGEALASMAAIAHVELKSKLYEQELGTRLTIEGSKVITHENCATNNGTSISIKNLFYNVPARRNFLKSDNVELKHITDELFRVAMANEDCSFSYFQNDKEILNLAVSTIKKRIVDIFGVKYNEKLVPVSEKTSLISISGFVGKPEFSKKTRGDQFFFVNKRFIKSGYLHHAVNNAFKDLITEGQHPSYFLYFTIDPKFIDINIHPTKTEIKFEDEKSIYAIIRSSVKRALGVHNIVPTLDFEKDPSFIDIPITKNTATQPSIKVDTSYNPFEKPSLPTKEYNAPKQPKKDNWSSLYEELPNIDIVNKPNESIKFPTEQSDHSVQSIFQINNKFIAMVIDSGLMIIHQERAHERILYEYYKNTSNEEKESQQLLFPKTVELSASDIGIVKEMSNELLNIGFRFDYLNANSLVVLGTPQDLGMESLDSVFEELIEQYKMQSSINKDNKFALSIAKSMCIKSGRKLNLEEMKSVVDSLFACQIPNTTATGKPTLTTLSLEEINKKF
ncbi:MAG: DNA mismatch repair endonuclease MutL [Flavobacteriales bacterium]